MADYQVIGLREPDIKRLRITKIGQVTTLNMSQSHLHELAKKYGAKYDHAKHNKLLLRLWRLEYPDGRSHDDPNSMRHFTYQGITGDPYQDYVYDRWVCTEDNDIVLYIQSR